MGLDSKPVQGDAAAGPPSSSIRRMKGTVVRQTEKHLEVQVRNGSLKAPPDSRFHVGDKVQVVVGPDGSVKLMPAGEERPPTAASVSQKNALVQLSGQTSASEPGAQALKGEMLYAQLEKGRSGVEYFGRIVSLLAQPDSAPRHSDGIPAFWKYAVEVYGRQLEVNSNRALGIGDWLSFSLEKTGTGLIMKQAAAAEAVPARLTALLAEANREYHPTFRLAFDTLAPFSEEPYFKRAVIEFGDLLGESGLFTGPKAESIGRNNIPSLSENPSLQSLADFQGPVLRPGIQQQLESLLSLFLTFPKDPEHSAVQAALWGQAVQNPFFLLPLLGDALDILPVKPEETGTVKSWSGISEHEVFRFGPNSKLPADPALPERFTLRDLYRFLDRSDDAGKSDLSGKLTRFVMEALQNEASTNRDNFSGDHYFGYYRHRDRWHGVRMRWEIVPSKGKNKKPSLNFRIEALTDNMGQVILDTAMDSAGAELHFQHERGSVETVLQESVKELEKELAYLDFKVKNYRISQIASKNSNAVFTLFSGIQPGKDAEGGSHIDLKA